MGNIVAQYAYQLGSVRVLGLDLDAESVAVASVLLSAAGDTLVETVRVVLMFTTAGEACLTTGANPRLISDWL